MPRTREQILTDEDYAAIMEQSHKAKPAAVNVCTEPSHEGLECLQASLPELAHDLERCAAILKAILEYNRVKVIGGWFRGRCLACNIPHIFWRKCRCPHHKAVELLKELGVEVEAT